MERGFETHQFRIRTELDGLWNFRTQKGDARRVSVPSCWETYPGLERYQGKASYEKKFEGGGNLHFIFKGVSHTADCYLDGVKIAHHYNAFTPFETLVENVERGTHTLRIDVDNSFNEESSLHVMNDYYTYGGINRPVIVEEVEDIYIERIHFTPIRTEKGWNGKISVRVRKIGEGIQKIRIGLALDDETFGDLTGELTQGVTVLEETFSFPNAETYEYRDFLPGSAEVNNADGEINIPAPKLYYLTAEVWVSLGEDEEMLLDDMIERIGFREVHVEGNRILFNGRPIKLRGFNRHEDHGLYGCAIPYDAMDYDLRLFEDLHANAVRTCHYPNDERFLDLCDELGILVWEEGHARGLSEEQMRHKNFRKQSLDCIEEMIDNHYNHPSIYIWGILNECASHTEYGKEIYAEQFALIKQMDQTRPTTFASCQFFKDISFDLVDVVSMNLYPLWYHDTPVEEYLTQINDWIQGTSGAGKPIIISEIGAGAIPGYHAPGNPKWTEDRQKEIISEQLTGVLGREDFSGVYLWQFCDGRVPDGYFYSRPRCLNNKGIVDQYRNRKQSYEAVKSIYAKAECGTYK